MKILKKVLNLFSNKSVTEQNKKTVGIPINNQSSNLSQSKLNQWEKEDEEIIQEIRELEAKNKAWSNDFNRMMKYRNEAKELEKEGKKEDALNLYLTSLKISEKSECLQYGNYYADIHRIIVLYTKLKLNEDLKHFLEYLIKEYGEDEDWKIRLLRLDKEPEKKISTLRKEDISIKPAESPTIWEKITNIKNNLPEFNFYYDLPEGENTINYQNGAPFESFQALREYRQIFESYLKEGKLAETEGNLKEAIEIYEKLILEKCEKPDPYDRLIIIYSKLKWIDSEIDTLQRAITFFEQMKNKQLEYVRCLAAKYGMAEKAEEYISQNQKITYFMGAFELYNPQTTRLQKWNLRLKKLKNKQ
ncbi:tetratricopeptide repeat protein [Myroides odoratimimus]|uniref:tetratricopeptide repeat protein n=1 Tax=Myroides odoratimimus TaxID=76832 RepID=UPI002577B22F|nr:hypothetical protein [Myroides odoratimimus]MDM1060839.1 hypothetical protein [Myroides odoratimimus]